LSVAVELLCVEEVTHTAFVVLLSFKLIIDFMIIIKNDSGHKVQFLFMQPLGTWFDNYKPVVLLHHRFA